MANRHCSYPDDMDEKDNLGLHYCIYICICQEMLLKEEFDDNSRIIFSP